MDFPASLGRLRQALAAENPAACLALLAQLREQAYPAALLRSVLASCHPGLDPVFLDLDLVPATILLAPRFPEVLGESCLDPLQVEITHGCDLPTFVAEPLNHVLRGERPLYAGLPALNIGCYQQMLQLRRAGRRWLRTSSALDCLAGEACLVARAQVAPPRSGTNQPVTALARWAPSQLDGLLEHPWIWIQGPEQQDGARMAQALALDGSVAVSDASSAAQLVLDASRRVLEGGAHYLLWNRAEPPPASWLVLVRGLAGLRCRPFCQLVQASEGVREVLPQRPSADPALLAISAHWLARRQPHQVRAFLGYWLAGPAVAAKPRLDPDLLRHRDQPLRPAPREGVLVLAATAAQVAELGLDWLGRRARQLAVEGGFLRAGVLQLGGGAAGDPAQQLRLLAGQEEAGAKAVLALVGPHDQLAPGAWQQLAGFLAWHPRHLCCSDEEVVWCQSPHRYGQRQFAAQPTAFRLLSRGQLAGLVSLVAAELPGLEWQPSYGSLHALVKDLGLQWLERGGEVTALPQALLRREPTSNPTLLPISTPDQRHLFTAEQLLELEQLTRRRAAVWLVPGGSLLPGPRQGSFRLHYSPTAADLVSVIIPFRDQAALTRQCVVSLLAQAGPTPLELVLVDNGSVEPEAMALAEELAPLAAAHGIRLVGSRDDSPFNFAALNNRARQLCRGNFLLFLNNDICFASPGPIEDLLHPFAMGVTAAVSARLLFEDGTIQHHGLAVAARQPHDILSPGKGLRPLIDTEPFAVLELQEQWSAATAACLLIRSSAFDELEGFDESFVVAYNDVDLCWRLTAAGRAVIVTPAPRIIHAESKSRGNDFSGEKRNRLARESAALRGRYPHRFQQGDLLYHRFLGPASHRFEPMALPAQPLAPARDRILSAWVREGFQPGGQRPFLIYVHWDANGQVRPDVLEQLRAYRGYADLAFVSAAPELRHRPRAMATLRRLCDVVLVRHNEGYDFGSWQAGLAFCKPYLQHVSRLILTNDSCYGPLNPLHILFERLAGSRADVVGLTESTAIRSHLQSYFIAYGARVLHSALFWAFWEKIAIWPAKLDLVMAYEVGWSGVLADAGFTQEALFLAGQHGNVTHTHWRELLEELQFPFLKTELLRLNPIRQDIDAWPQVAMACNPRVAAMISDHLATPQQRK